MDASPPDPSAAMPDDGPLASTDPASRTSEPAAGSAPGEAPAQVDRGDELLPGGPPPDPSTMG
jgi:hypothetical protein